MMWPNPFLVIEERKPINRSQQRVFGINSNETRRAPFINQSEPTIQSSFFDEETYPEDEFADFPPPPDFLQTDKEFSPSTERKNSIAQIGVPSIGPNFLAEKLRTVFISIPLFSNRQFNSYSRIRHVLSPTIFSTKYGATVKTVVGNSENLESWAALNERVELNSRSSSRTSRSSRNHNSHKIRDARVQQKLTLNATKVESLNLPPPSNQDDRFKDSGNSV